jgi:hypothetical protein
MKYIIPNDVRIEFANGKKANISDILDGTPLRDLSWLCGGKPYELKIGGDEGWFWVYGWHYNGQLYASMLFNDAKQDAAPLDVMADGVWVDPLYGSEGICWWDSGLVRSMGNLVQPDAESAYWQAVVDSRGAIASNPQPKNTGSSHVQLLVDWRSDLGRRRNLAQWREASMAIAAYECGRPMHYIHGGLPVGAALGSGHGEWTPDAQGVMPYDAQHNDNAMWELWTITRDPVYLFLLLSTWMTVRHSSPYLQREPNQSYGSPRTLGYHLRQTAQLYLATKDILPGLAAYVLDDLIWHAWHANRNWDKLQWTIYGSGENWARDPVTGQLDPYQLWYQTAGVCGLGFAWAGYAAPTTLGREMAMSMNIDWLSQCFDASRDKNAAFASQFQRGVTKTGKEAWGGSTALWPLSTAIMLGFQDDPAVQAGWDLVKHYLTKGIAQRGEYCVAPFGPVADPLARIYPEPIV